MVLFRSAIRVRAAARIHRSPSAQGDSRVLPVEVAVTAAMPSLAIAHRFDRDDGVASVAFGATRRSSVAPLHSGCSGARVVLRAARWAGTSRSRRRRPNRRWRLDRRLRTLTARSALVVAVGVRAGELPASRQLQRTPAQATVRETTLVVAVVVAANAEVRVQCIGASLQRLDGRRAIDALVAAFSHSVTAQCSASHARFSIISKHFGHRSWNSRDQACRLFASLVSSLEWNESLSVRQPRTSRSLHSPQMSQRTTVSETVLTGR